MAHWLIKSEPSAYAWARMARDKKTGWTGVRNQSGREQHEGDEAGRHLLLLPLERGQGDRRHREGGAAVPPRPTDKTGKFGMVEMEAVKALVRPVTLAAIKVHPTLKTMAFVRQSRLSVSPVTAAEWKTVCGMGGIR